MTDETKDDLSASSMAQDDVALTESGGTAKKSRGRSRTKASDETEGTPRKRGRKPARKQQPDPENSEAVMEEQLIPAEQAADADDTTSDAKPARQKRTRRTTSRSKTGRQGTGTKKSKEAAEESLLLTDTDESDVHTAAAEVQQENTEPSSQPENKGNEALSAEPEKPVSQPQRDWSSWKGWDDDEADSDTAQASETAKTDPVTDVQPVAPAAEVEQTPGEPVVAEAATPAPRLPRRKKPARTPVKSHMAGRMRREAAARTEPDPLKSAEELHDTDPMPESGTMPVAHDFDQPLPLYEEEKPSFQEQDAQVQDSISAVPSYEEESFETGQESSERNFADSADDDTSEYGYQDEDESEDQQRTHRRGRRGGRSHKKTLQNDLGLQGNTAEQTGGLTPAGLAPHGIMPAKHGKRRMFISVLPGEQVEVAFTTNGILDEYYLDMLHQKKIKGNIYRGVIVNIDINLQAAFVDFGTEKNGFLQIDEVHPEYFISSQDFAHGRKSPPIQNVLRLGQEVLVQVVKEPNGTKGAFLTTWISLAGRFLVLTPGQEQIAISRKVKDEEERRRLRELMNGIDPGDDLGVIVRTVSAGVTQTTLRNDLAYLKRTWNEVRKQATGVSAPACVYREPGLVERAVRDYLTDDVYELWVDNADVAERIKNTVALLFPH
ncbi:MAG: ribonuclease E/G, partial [Desulfovibrionaceae bacterium]|nr:ribonuclease E/G [Desulfovibrionaceae bacterium]